MRRWWDRRSRPGGSINRRRQQQHPGEGSKRQGASTPGHGALGWHRRSQGVGGDDPRARRTMIVAGRGGTADRWQWQWGAASLDVVLTTASTKRLASDEESKTHGVEGHPTRRVRVLLLPPPLCRSPPRPSSTPSAARCCAHLPPLGPLLPAASQAR
jgi:hypothetical protein